MAAQGEYDEAKPNYERALAIWEKALGAAHPKVATGLNSLGSLLEGRVLGSTIRRVVEVLRVALTCFVRLHGSPRQVRRGQAQLRACAGHLEEGTRRRAPSSGQWAQQPGLVAGG